MKIALLFTLIISIAYAQSDNSTQECVGKCSFNYCTATAKDCAVRKCEDSCGNTNCTKAVLNNATSKWSYSDCS
jgi:hypothetical protein